MCAQTVRYGTPIVELGLGAGVNGKFLMDTGEVTLLSDGMARREVPPTDDRHKSARRDNPAGLAF